MGRWLPIATPVNLAMMCLCVDGVLLKKTDGGGPRSESFIIKPRFGAVGGLKRTTVCNYAGLWRGRAVMEDWRS